MRILLFERGHLWLGKERKKECFGEYGVWTRALGLEFLHMIPLD